MEHFGTFEYLAFFFLDQLYSLNWKFRTLFRKMFLQKAIIITSFFDLWGNDTKGYAFSGKMIRLSSQHYTYAEVSYVSDLLFTNIYLYIRNQHLNFYSNTYNFHSFNHSRSHFFPQSLEQTLLFPYSTFIFSLWFL